MQGTQIHAPPEYRIISQGGDGTGDGGGGGGGDGGGG
jgi:hypothetical protein